MFTKRSVKNESNLHMTEITLNTLEHAVRQHQVHREIVSITLLSDLPEGWYPEQEHHFDDLLRSNLLDEIKDKNGFHKSEGYWYCNEMMREIDEQINHGPIFKHI